MCLFLASRRLLVDRDDSYDVFVSYDSSCLAVSKTSCHKGHEAGSIRTGDIQVLSAVISTGRRQYSQSSPRVSVSQQPKDHDSLSHADVA